MGITRLYILLLLAFCTWQASGQSDFLSKSRQPTPEGRLKEAEGLIGQDNDRATNIISQVIELSKDANDNTTLAKAYILLGDINANAKLDALAIRRYKEAKLYLTTEKDNPLRALLHYKLGKLNQQNDLVAAKVEFVTCMDLENQSELYYLCYEGLANSLEKQDSLDRAMNILTDLESYYFERDSSNLARIQARMSIVATSQSRIDLAYLNYSNARSNFRSGKVKTKDIETINSAKELISQSQISLDDEINFRKLNLSDYKEDDNTYQIEDQIQLANAYIKKGDLSNANKLITTAKESLSDKVNVTTRSKVYKESSEISALRGDYESALEDYKIYENTQQSLIDAKQLELENKISLLESQKKIDIDANVYDSNRKLGRSESKLVDFQKYIIYLLASLLLVALLSALWIYKSLRSKRITNKKLELKSLRAQMNPHFIFNALNSVNEYIATQDEVKANKYLTQFSKLMRKVLELNQKDLIPLSEELELTDLYLKLEHSRFRDQFDYEFIIDSTVKGKDIFVSPMLLQPYIENAIWHGLRYKQSKGFLKVKVSMNDSMVHILIEDNGIGRNESLARKTTHQLQHKATGMKNTAQRMNIIEDLYQTKYSIDISDAFPNEVDKGTKVYIQLFSVDV